MVAGDEPGQFQAASLQPAQQVGHQGAAGRVLEQVAGDHQAAQAVQVSRDVVRRFVAEGPTEAELKAAKDFMIGGFALRLDSNRKLLDNVANIAWYDLPLDYLDTWTARVQRITAADVRAAFARKLQPARMVTVTVGAETAR